MSFCVSTTNFYGPPTVKQRKIEKILKDSPIKKSLKTLPKYLNKLLGPSKTWKTFGKQQDALKFLEGRGSDLMPFAFEESLGQRSFLVCHPVVLWFVLSQRSHNRRCTYEIIQEGSISKLYLDLEYDKSLNNGVNGERMIGTILNIICVKLLESFQITCRRSDILELSSHTENKFSCHIIFQIVDAAFKDNYSVGCFVKEISQEIMDAVSHSDIMKRVCVKYNLSEDCIRELIVTDKKNVQKPFIDTSVYSKNRHFRLLGCTKLNKNTPLIVSCNNFFPIKEIEDQSVFLCSLVTHFIKKPSKTLQYGNNSLLSCKKTLTTLNVTKTPFISTKIEEFISQVIQPNGHIRKKTSEGNLITYDIMGNRYCGNVGRQHRSNNIKIIVDLNKMEFYQTCYDIDCKGYQSKAQPIPSELQFSTEDDWVLQKVADNILSDQDLLQLLESNDDDPFFYTNIPSENFNEEEDKILQKVDLDNNIYQNKAKSEIFESISQLNSDVPDFDVSDADLLEAAKIANL